MAQTSQKKGSWETFTPAKATPARPRNKKALRSWDAELNSRDGVEDNMEIPGENSGTKNIGCRQQSFPGDENTRNQINNGLDAAAKPSAAPSDGINDDQSSPVHFENLKRKRKNTGIDFNKEPQQRPKRKGKKYWPKILDESKPKKIPKPRKAAKNKVSKSQKPINPCTPEPSAPKRVLMETSSPEKSRLNAARALNFDVENQIKDEDGHGDVIQGMCTRRVCHDVSDALMVNLGELNIKARDFDFSPEIRRIVQQEQRYQRWKRKQIPIRHESRLKDIPKACKKSRMRRRKAKVCPQFLEAVLVARQIQPTVKQFCAAIMDPTSFKCVLAMQPKVKSRRIRSRRYTAKAVANGAVSSSEEVQCKDVNDGTEKLENFNAAPPSPAGKQSNVSIRESEYPNCLPLVKSSRKSSKKEVANSAVSSVTEIQLKDATEEVEILNATSPLAAEKLSNVSIRESEAPDCLPLVKSRRKKSIKAVTNGAGSMNTGIQLKDAKDVTAEQKSFDATLSFPKVPFQESIVESESPNCSPPLKLKRIPKTLAHKAATLNIESCHLEENEGLLDYLIQKLEYLSITDNCEELALQNQSSQSILYKGGKKKKPLALKVEKFVLQKSQLIPYKGKKKKNTLAVKVELDEKTLRAWNLLMDIDGSGVTEETNEQEQKYWTDQRDLFTKRVDSFIELMHLIQGNRRFSQWKGSVLDSVVGVILTQNVSDQLSSSAFMSLSSKFPIRSKDKIHDECEVIALSQESIGSNTERGGSTNVEVSSQSCASKNDQDVNNQFAEKKEENLVHKTENVASERKNDKKKEKQKNAVNWEDLRKTYSRPRESNGNSEDSVDWEAVRRAKVEEISQAILGRGQNNQLARRIKKLLDDLVKNHGSLDLEWLRDVPPDKAKDFMLSIDGLGLKSVECVRLLTLHHQAFPVDTNVGRISVRLGWVPLQKLPENVQIHLLKQYPLMDKIQKYLWPRLCKLDPQKLYELHYQMITFGKVFCTKASPNCNACPMRGDCLHFASAFASAKLRLPAPQEKQTGDMTAMQGSLTDGTFSGSKHGNQGSVPIVEFPASPVRESTEIQEIDIEDLCRNSEDDEIPTIRLDAEEFRSKLLNVLEEANSASEELDTSRALVTITPETASIPIPNLKKFLKLRKIHLVFELSDDHVLLEGFPKRYGKDPGRYLFALTGQDICCSNNIGKEQNDHPVYGTILIPCRTALDGNFPLNGTFFQVNEVFADDESSTNPIGVPHNLLLPLRRRLLFCGTSISAICKGLTQIQIQHIFCRGFFSSRGFNRRKREFTILSSQLCPIDRAKVEKDPIRRKKT